MAKRNPLVGASTVGGVTSLSSEGSGSRSVSGSEPVRLLEAVLRNASAGISFWRGPELVCELVNPAYQGFAPGKEFVGRRYAEVWPEALEPYESIMRRVLETGEPYSVENAGAKIQRERGGRLEEGYWNINYTPLPADASGRAGVLCITVETTGRVRAEKELREGEEKYRLLFDNMTEGFGLNEIILDADGKPCDWRFLELNAAWERQTGIPRAGIIGKTMRQVWPDLDGHWLEKFGKVALTGEPVSCEGYNPHLQRWFEIFAYSTKPGHFAVVFVDITERKRADEALATAHRAIERERNVLQAVMNGASEAHLVYLDPEFNFVCVNETYARSCGYRPEEMIGKNHFALYPHAENEAIFKRVRDTGESVTHHDKPFEFPDQPGRGVTYWNWTLSPVKNAAGRVEGLVFALFETTERKRAVEALRETNERLTKVLSVEAVGVMFWDLTTGCLVDANDTFLKLMGYSRSDLEAHDLTWQKFTPPEYHEVSQAEIKKFQMTGRVGPYEKEYFQKDGTRRWLLFSGSSLGGNMCVEFCVDIADRKRAEEALRESEERFRRYFELGLIGMAITSPTKGWMEVNAEVCAILGYDRSELMQKTWAELTHPDDVAADMAQFNRVLAGEIDGYSLEKRFVRKDARVVYTALSVRCLRRLDNSVNYFVVLLQDITERKRAEERLGADLAALTRMHELSGMVLVAGGLDSLLQEVMNAAVAIIGAERGTLQLLQGGTLRIVAHYGHKQPFLDFFASAQTRASVCGEATRRGERVVVPDVEASPLFGGTESLAVLREAGVRAVQSTPIMSRSGELLGILTTQWGRPHTPDEHDLWRIDLLARQAADLIEQVRAGEALAEQARLLDLSSDAIIVRSPGDRVSYWNKGAEELYGYARQEALGQTTHELLKPEFPESLEDIYERMQREKRWEGELIHTRKDGSRVTTLSRWVPDWDSQGRLRATLETNNDISARKEAEAALRRSEERFRVAQELSPDGFSILSPVRDEGGRVVDFTWVYENATAARFTGKQPSELLGRRLLELFPGHRGTGLFKAYQEVAETRERRLVEAHYGAETIASRWFRVAVVPVGGDIAVLAQDITQQKEFQAELERLVAERTAKLQELVGELEHFSYTITHDLKSPLRAMRGFAEMASMACEEEGGKAAKEFLGRISTSAERMDRLIADALSYSRTVRQELPLEDVDAGALLRGMLDSYPEFQPAKAQIHVEGRLPVVLANEAGLTQVFSNLLGNAAKFVKPGDVPDIRVWAEGAQSQRSTLHSQPGQWVRIWVEDKGIGISNEMLPRIFQMFSRGSKEYEGTGIGLALVRKVVQRMGGKVGVESEEGRGSRFWIELKCGEAKQSGGELTFSPRATEDSGAVLYVEDEESDAIFMERAFAEKGMAGKLRVVGDGRAAINYLSGSGEYGDRGKYPVPALVVLDLNLPQVPGFEVLRWMRNNPDYARTPVVVFSSSTREDDRAMARELGANEFVSKPSSGLEFGGVVDGLKDRWVGRR